MVVVELSPYIGTRAESVGPAAGSWKVKADEEGERSSPSKVSRSCVVCGSAVAKVLSILHELGLPRVRLRSDQEPAIVALKEAVQAKWEKEATLEESPAYDSQANGAIEREVRTIKEQRHAMRLALEDRVQSDVPNLHPIMSWLVAHAGALIRRTRVGADGRTPLERCRSQSCLRPMPEFGEMVMGRLLVKEPDDPDNRFVRGVFLGVRDRSGELIIGLGDMVWKIRDFRRLPAGEQWDAAAVLGITVHESHPNG